MDINQEVALLRRVPLFAQIEPARLKLLAFTAERLTYEAGEVLFEKGDEGDAAYVLLTGQADVIIRAGDGDQVVASLGKNELVGEIALLCDVPRTATIRAASGLETLRIDKQTFLRLLAEFPEAAAAVMRELALRLAHTTRDLLEARRSH